MQGLKESVLRSGVEFESITKSAFIEHIGTSTILVDKTLTIVEFLASDRDVPRIPDSDDNAMEATAQTETTIKELRDLCQPEVSTTLSKKPKPDKMYLYCHRHVSMSRPRGFGKTMILANDR